MNKIAFFVAVILQFTVLISITVYRYSVIAGGKTVYLKTVPVDPRSLFQGDYVILDYEISRLDSRELDEKRYYEKESRVYVKLRPHPEKKYWVPVSLTEKPPALQENEAVIRGKVKECEAMTEQDEKGGFKGWYYVYRIQYPIDSYFVPEGKGKPIEDAMRRSSEKEVLVEVKLNRIGDAVITGLLVDGVRH
ncbi:MAG: GDYXXLXY domain-containing protein [Planctomycetota bacterium]|nr:GDYXXLXY domain-containing protein [Planctomycetota bacterium]